MKETEFLVVFDMDGVLVRPRSSWRVVHEALGTNNEDSFKAYIRGEIDDMEFMARDIGLWLDRMETPGLEPIKDILDRVATMKGFHNCMESLRTMGARTAIISGGLDILASRLGQLGGFHDIHSNGIEIDERGNLTGNGILRVPLRDKGSVLKDVIDLTGPYGSVVVIGDSQVDLSMFRMADLSIAFRPESHDVSDGCDLVIREEDLSLVPGRITDRIGP